MIKTACILYTLLDIDNDGVGVAVVSFGLIVVLGKPVVGISVVLPVGTGVLVVTAVAIAEKL